MVSGLPWEEELLFPNSLEFQREATVLGRELGRILTLGYFGTSLRYVEVEGFFKNARGVLVDFYVEFNGFWRDVSSEDMGEDFKKTLKVHAENGTIVPIGDFKVDVARNYFVVVDAIQPLEIVGGEVEEDSLLVLPDWAWLVIFFGVSTSVIISIIGGVACYKRIQVEKAKRTINNTTLDAFKDLFDQTKDISDVEEKADEQEKFRMSKDRSDMWTLQRKREADQKKQFLRTFQQVPPQYPAPPSIGSCGGESACSSLDDDMVLKKSPGNVVNALKKGIKRASLRHRGESTNVSNLNLLEESFESVSSFDDDNEARI